MAKAKFIKELKSGGTPKDKKKVGTIEQLVKSKKPIIISEMKDAKILIGKIIYDLQINKIEEKRAKTICYALTVAIQIYRESEFEHRLIELERKAGIQ
jgi:hypothetical protein